MQERAEKLSKPFVPSVERPRGLVKGAQSFRDRILDSFAIISLPTIQLRDWAPSDIERGEVTFLGVVGNIGFAYRDWALRRGVFQKKCR